MKFDRDTFKVLTVTTQIGVTSVGAIIIGLFLGLWLDEVFKNKIWIIVGVVLGIIVAIKSVWDMLKELL